MSKKNSGIRKVCFDSELKIEAYQFIGVMQKFPNHFHECYVIGFIEAGRRKLFCKDSQYVIKPGDIILFNPSDAHSCEQDDGGYTDYRCMNIPVDIMQKITFEITGMAELPYFQKNIFSNSDLFEPLRNLHNMIMQKERDFHKEEIFLFLMGSLLAEGFSLKRNNFSDCKIEKACSFLKENYSKDINLDELSSVCNLSKYYFVKFFTREKGISPYRYLQTLRIEKAKELLEQGRMPADVSVDTGFSDQSHFSNYFKDFTGLTPGQYRNIFMMEDDSNNV